MRFRGRCKMARLKVYIPNYATRLQGKYLWNEYFTLHKFNLSFHSPALNAPFSKFENRKSASFRLKMGGFELLNAPERRHVFLARLKLHKCIEWIRSFPTLTSELFYDK